MRAPLLVLLLALAALPHAVGQEPTEDVLLEDPQGDAFEVGTPTALAECVQPCPVPLPPLGVPAPPSMDLLAVRLRETPQELHVVFEVAELTEDLAGIVDAEAGGRGALFIVCWDRDDFCNEAVRFTARWQGGAKAIGASYGYRDERCNTIAVCGWSLPFELTFGSPGAITVRVPRSLPPLLFDEGTTLAVPQAGVARLVPTPTTLMPPEGPEVVGEEQSTTVDHVPPGEDHVLRTPRAEGTPAAAPIGGYGGGLLVGRESEADLLALRVVETPTTLTFSMEFAFVSESPVDQALRLEWAFQGARYHLVDLTVSQRQRSMTSVACNPSDTLGCQDSEDVPAVYEIVPGAPGFVNVTYVRVDVGAPASGAVSARAIAVVRSGTGQAAGASSDYDTTGLLPPFALRNATRSGEAAPGAVRVDDAPSDARIPALEDAPDASAVEIVYVEAQALQAGGVRVTLNLRDPRPPTLPTGYTAALRAAAIEEGGRTTLVGALTEESGGESYFCAPDTLVLTGGAEVPPPGTRRRIAASMETEETGGNLTFLVPAECLAPADAVGTRRAARLGGGTFLVRDALGGGEAVRADDVVGTGPFDLVLVATAGVAPVIDEDGASLLWVPLLVAGAVVLAGGGVTAAILLRRERAPVLPAPGVLFLGKYLVDRELGRGGFGAVWLATHVRLDRKVVIKQLQSSWVNDAGAVERFRREARVLAKLDHPHVTRVYDAEEVSGLAFIVMEFVEGGTLGDLRPKPASPAIVGRVGAQLLDALAAIHDAGIVHGDLKPDNVLLAADQGVRVADFGIARPVEAAPTGTGAMKTVGYGSEGPIGTPLFMAPEQLGGAPATRASDVYAAAAVVHHLATGRLLFSPAPVDVVSARAAHARGAPDTGEGVAHPAIVAWLRRGLARDPADRFRDAREMREALLEAVSVAQRA